MRKPAPTPEANARDLAALQLHDLKERRRSHAERRVLWVVAAVLLYVGLKWSGVV